MSLWSIDVGEQLDDQAFLWAHEHVGKDAANFAAGEAGGRASQGSEEIASQPVVDEYGWGQTQQESLKGRRHRSVDWPRCGGSSGEGRMLHSWPRQSGWEDVSRVHTLGIFLHRDVGLYRLPTALLAAWQ